MNGQGRQQYSAPTFPPPPTGEHAPGQARERMTTGLPDYAYRAMYDNQEANQYPPPPSHSHSSARSRRSAHGAYGSRYGDDHGFGTRRLEDGHYESERRTRTSDRRPRRRPASSYDSSDRSYDSRETRHHRDDRRRGGELRSRSSRRDHENDKRDQEVQKQQQQQQQEQKKTGFEKFEEYITPFNVGILMGCMDLIGGTISLYMTNKRFSKKALAKGPAPGEPGASSSGGGDDKKKGSADKQQDKNGSSSSKVSSSRGSRSTRSTRSRGRSERSRRDYSSDSSSTSSSSGSSYWSNSDTRRYRHMPERLEYDSRGRVISGAARAAHRGATHVRRR